MKSHKRLDDRGLQKSLTEMSVVFRQLSNLPTGGLNRANVVVEDQKRYYR